jgi:hypothetical protein
MGGWAEAAAASDSVGILTRVLQTLHWTVLPHQSGFIAMALLQPGQ